MHARNLYNVYRYVQTVALHGWFISIDLPESGIGLIAISAAFASIMQIITRRIMWVAKTT